jgi:nucleoside-triphosphatase
MIQKMILLTGEPRIGKSTAIKKLISLLSTTGLVGFYTEEVRENDNRIGFVIKTLDGKQGMLASVTSDSELRIGRYGVNMKAFEEICLPCIIDGMVSGKTLIIDEIGPMQMYSEKYKELLLQLVDLKYPTIGTIFYHSHPWIDDLKASNNIKLIELTLENRDNIPHDLYKIFNNEEVNYGRD